MKQPLVDRTVGRAPAPPRPTWERALGGLLDDNDLEPEHTPVGILIEPATGPRRDEPARAQLRIRPVVPGVRGGWIRTGVSWETFAGGYYGFGRVSFADEHRDALTALADAHRRSVRAFGYGRMPDAILLDHLGPGWVALLRAADRAGVRLLTDLAEGGEVAFAPDPAELVVDVVRTDDGAELHPRLDLPAGAAGSHHPGRAAGHRLLAARRRDPRARRARRAARRHPSAPARPRRRRGARGRLGPLHRHPPARAAAQGPGARGIRRPRPAGCRAAAAHAARHLRAGAPGAPGVGVPLRRGRRWGARADGRRGARPDARPGRRACAGRRAARGRGGRRVRPAVAGRGPHPATGARDPAARVHDGGVRRAAARARGAAVGRADRRRRARDVQRGGRRAADPGVDVRPGRRRAHRLVRPRHLGHGGRRGRAAGAAHRGDRPRPRAPHPRQRHVVLARPARARDAAGAGRRGPLVAGQAHRPTAHLGGARRAVGGARRAGRRRAAVRTVEPCRRGAARPRCRGAGRAAGGARRDAAAVPGRRVPLAVAAVGLRPRRGARRRHGPGQDAADARDGAAGARARRARRPGARRGTDLGAVDVGERGGPVRPVAAHRGRRPHPQQGRARSRGDHRGGAGRHHLVRRGAHRRGGVPVAAVGCGRPRRGAVREEPPGQDLPGGAAAHRAGEVRDHRARRSRTR